MRIRSAKLILTAFLLCLAVLNIQKAVGQNIRFLEDKKLFALQAGPVSYVFGINERNELQHVYWGGAVPRAEEFKTPKVLSDWASFDLTTTTTPQEFAGWGAGLYSEPALKVTYPDGNRDRLDDAVLGAASRGAELVVLPELAASGYAFRDAAEARAAAEPAHGPSNRIRRCSIVTGQHDDAQAFLAQRGDGLPGISTDRIGDREQPGELAVDRYQHDTRTFAPVLIGKFIERGGINPDPAHLRRIADHDLPAIDAGAHPRPGL